MNVRKIAAVIMASATLSGCGDAFSCDNPESIRAINEIVTSNALNKMNLSTYKKFGSVGLTPDSLALRLDNIHATDSNPSVNSLTCKAQLTVVYSDKEKARMKRIMGLIEDRAKGMSNYDSSRLFIDNVNTSARRMANTRTVTGTVEYIVYNTKDKVITEVSNTPNVNKVIDDISYKLLYPTAQLFEVNNNTLPLDRFYSKETLYIFNQ
ncbi:hypothetical protein [Serratia fonticola]|uniref:hypothetical protein n=1 Tax=Serratia fonticola TaxID=47917 RepID=UPI001644178E|nr:hypothetical protein [Serratia fonticola]MBC3216683.1 hypothetical protein [Serratia fonticola]